MLEARILAEHVIASVCRPFIEFRFTGSPRNGSARHASRFNGLGASPAATWHPAADKTLAHYRLLSGQSPAFFDRLGLPTTRFKPTDCRRSTRHPAVRRHRDCSSASAPLALLI